MFSCDSLRGMEVLDVVTEDFVVNCYKAVEQYLLTTRSVNVPLDMLPMIYENICKQKFPLSLSILARGLLDHLFVITTPATGVPFIEIARIQNTTRDGILAVHRDRISRLRDALSPKPVQISDDKVAKSVQLILRGLHRALQLNPVSASATADVENYCRSIFFTLWKVPLLLEGTGFSSVAALVDAFPRVFQKGAAFPTPQPQPDFAVGNRAYVRQTDSVSPKPSSSVPIGRNKQLTQEQAQMVDSFKGAMALLKVELMECGRDREKYNQLSAKLAIKHKQLEEVMSSLQTTSSTPVTSSAFSSP